MTDRSPRSRRPAATLLLLAGLLSTAGPALATSAPFQARLCRCAGPLYDACLETPAPAITTGTQLDLCVLPQPTPQPTTTGTVCNPSIGIADGNEVCGWEASVVADAGLSILDFSPQSGFVAHVADDVLALNRLAGQGGDVGAMHVGSLTVAPSGPCESCSVHLDVGKSGAYDAAFDFHAFDAEVFAVPEPGRALVLGAGLLLLLALRRRRARLPLLAAALAIPLLGGPARAQTLVLDSMLENGELGLTAPTGLGSALAALGDLDADGVEDFAVGLPERTPEGSVMLVFPRPDRTVRSTLLIGQGQGGFGGSLSIGDDFGRSLAAVGDSDGNGIPELAVGAPGSSSLWILALGPGGTLLGQSQLVSTVFSAGDEFGAALAGMGDIDGDGAYDLAVGAPGANSGRGAVSVLRMSSTGDSILSEHVFPAVCTGLGFVTRRLGQSLARLGDLDGNGVDDLAAGCPVAPFGGRSDAYLILLDASFAFPASAQLVEGGVYTAGVGVEDGFGSSLASIPDLDGSGTRDLAIGAPEKDGGRVHLLRLGLDGGVPDVLGGVRVDDGDPSMLGIITPGGAFGEGLGSFDIDSDGTPELWVGAALGASGTAEPFFSFDLQDSDDDGVPDFLDSCPFVRNTGQADSDGDGVGDLCDNCPQIANAIQDNADGDYYGDACQPPIVSFRENGSTGDPSWDVYLECQGRPVSRLVVGGILEPDVDLGHVRFGGGCDLPPDLFGGSGCAASTQPELLGATVEASASGAYIAGGLAGGIREDTVYLVLEAASGSLCDTEEEYLGTIDFTTEPVLSAFPRLAATNDGLFELYGDASLLFDGTKPFDTVETTVYSTSLPPVVDATLQVVPGSDLYQVCFQSFVNLHRLSFSLVPPLDAANAPMDLTWVGCDTAAAQGLFTCSSGVATNVSTATSFALGPLSGEGGLDPTRLYVSLEGSIEATIDPHLALNDRIGIDPSIPMTCVGAVAVSSPGGQPPALDTGPGLTSLPYFDNAGEPLLDSLEFTPVGGFATSAVIGLDDADGDAIADEPDNCVFRANPGQENSGGLNVVSPPGVLDVSGDACECGEAEGDGTILSSGQDVPTLQDYLVGSATAPEIPDRCSVDGDAKCTLLDAITLQAAIEGGSIVGASCAAANGI